MRVCQRRKSPPFPLLFLGSVWKTLHADGFMLCVCIYECCGRGRRELGLLEFLGRREKKKPFLSEIFFWRRRKIPLFWASLCENEEGTGVGGGSFLPLIRPSLALLGPLTAKLPPGMERKGGGGRGQQLSTSRNFRFPPHVFPGKLMIKKKKLFPFSLFKIFSLDQTVFFLHLQVRNNV